MCFDSLNSADNWVYINMKRLTLQDLQTFKATGEAITCVTAYDYAGIQMAEDAEIDILIPHDWGIGTALFGQTSSSSVTIEHVLFYLKGIVQSVRRAYILAPLPYGAYEISNEQAIRNAAKLIKEGADSVILQGSGIVLERIVSLTEVGIPCMGYLGYTPQQVKKLGHERVVGDTAQEAVTLFNDTIAMEKAGAWGVILQNVPELIAKEITDRTKLITIGLGGTRGCNGQMALMHDLLGWPLDTMPLFSIKYADFFHRGLAALNTYYNEVQNLVFPEAQHTFAIADADYELFLKEIKKES